MVGKVERRFKVVGGSGEPPPPNESCVQHLEEALDLAKQGILQSVVIVGMTHDKVMINGWSETDSVFSTLGALTQTVTDYQNRELEQYQPDTLRIK